MFTSWNISDLDLTNAFDVIPDTNPERSLRYSIPVPNWLNGKGQPAVSHPAIHENKEGSNDWRFIFFNHKDKCDQALRIDGTGSVMFAGISPDQAEKLTDLIEGTIEDIDRMTPEQLSFILDYAKEELNLSDRYTKKQFDLHNEMDPWKALHHERLGSFLPKINVSSCVFIPGNGEFIDGPTPTPQRFENGAFITFPGHAVSELVGLNAAELKFMKPKVVQSDVFMATRTHVNGDPVTAADCKGDRRTTVFVPAEQDATNDQALHIN